MVHNELHSKTHANKLLNPSPPLQDPLGRNGVNKVVLNIVHHAPQHLQEVLSSRTTKSESLHEVKAATINQHQMRNTVLGDSEAMKVHIRGPRTPEVYKTKVIDLRLINAGEKGCSFIPKVWNVTELLSTSN